LQVDATKTMAATQIKKADHLKDLNILLLMTLVDKQIMTAEAKEYLNL